ncbi:MAG: NADH-quinone oxidoreductase subunit C [Dehalococcoidia bacterium]
MGLKTLAGSEAAPKIEEKLSGSIIEINEDCIMVAKDSIAGVMQLLKESPEFDFNYINNITAVDNLDHFEVVYNITSLTRKHTLCVKARVPGRDAPEIPSVTSVWKGADFQEREVYDLMGILFIDHPNLKRIALWAGFEGHPLRKDFL